MTASIDVEYPFTGRWLVLNSPADRVPSHGTTLFATSYAIDFLPVDDDGRTAPIGFGSLVRPEPPERFEPDHPAYRGLPSIGYALTQRRRATAGWAALAGNHVMIEAGGGFVLLCHLRLGSVTARLGQRVLVGDEVGLCGNSGNSTEPHVHVQAIDNRDVHRAGPVRLTFRGSIPRNGEIVDVP
jgi:hypothetical protein